MVALSPLSAFTIKGAPTVWEESTREWNKQKLDVVYANQAQHSLFDVEETKRIFKVAKK